MTQIDQQNVPRLRFPGFEGAWKLKKVRDYGRVIRGASPRPKADPRFYGPGVPRLMVEDVARDGKYANPITDSLTPEGAKLSRLCPSGTLTIVCSGTAKTVGQASFLLKEACIHDGFLALVDIDTDQSHDFIYYQIQRLQQHSERLATHGGTFINLTTEILRDFERAFPPKSEQVKITEFLNSVDTKIAQLAEKKRLLEDYKKGCMQQLFSQKIRFKDDTGNDFPDWEEKRLGDVAQIIGGGTPESGISDYWSGGISWFTPSEIKRKYLSNSQRTISQNGLRASSAKILPVGVLLLSTRATVGDVGIAQKECCTNQGFQSLIMKDENVNEFWYYWIKEHKRELLRRASGSTFLEIGKAELSKIRAQTPHAVEQRKIAEFLSALDRKIDLVGQELTQARTFKQGLLQQMFV